MRVTRNNADPATSELQWNKLFRGLFLFTESKSIPWTVISLEEQCTLCKYTHKVYIHTYILYIHVCSWKDFNPKGNQPWILTGRTGAEVEVLILWPPDVENQLTGKDPDAGKDWRQKEKGKTEDETVGWHHWLSGHEFKQTPGDSEGQGSLACCSSQGCTVGHDLATERQQKRRKMNG